MIWVKSRLDVILAPLFSDQRGHASPQFKGRFQLAGFGLPTLNAQRSSIPHCAKSATSPS